LFAIALLTMILTFETCSDRMSTVVFDSSDFKLIHPANEE
jgi:hypothetical protein